MTSTKINHLKKQYTFVCNAYVAKFCKKQEMDFEGWVADTTGGIACCNDFFFNLYDIALDVNTKQPKCAIVSWYYQNIDNPQKSINYYSFTKGLRVSHIK